MFQAFLPMMAATVFIMAEKRVPKALESKVFDSLASEPFPIREGHFQTRFRTEEITGNLLGKRPVKLQLHLCFAHPPGKIRASGARLLFRSPDIFYKEIK